MRDIVLLSLVTILPYFTTIFDWYVDTEREIISTPEIVSTPFKRYPSFFIRLKNINGNMEPSNMTHKVLSV